MTRLLLVGLAAFGFGCARNPDSSTQICTLIGCSDGVNVEVSGNRTGHIAVEVIAGGVTVDSFDCEATDASCRSFIEGLTEQRVTVTIRSGDQNTTRSYDPQYRDVRPNGPSCPPTCRQATVQVTV